MPVDPSLLDRANWWFDISWYGLLWSGLATALAACATVSFLFLQYWSTSVRDRHSEWRTSTLELETGKAKAELTRANADIAKAHAEIAQAQAQTAVLEKEAAVARLEQERLKQIVGWRTLSKEAADKVVHRLSERKEAIKLEYVGGDPEVLWLAIQFSKVLESAQWKFAASAKTFASALVFDIRLPGPENETVKLLRAAFTEAQVPFSTDDVPASDMGFIHPSEETPSATLFIGSKRPPF